MRDLAFKNYLAGPPYLIAIISQAWRSDISSSCGFTVAYRQLNNHMWCGYERSQHRDA
jgi:hypothetical protein